MQKMERTLRFQRRTPPFILFFNETLTEQKPLERHPFYKGHSLSLRKGENGWGNSV